MNVLNSYIFAFYYPFFSLSCTSFAYSIQDNRDYCKEEGISCEYGNIYLNTRNLKPLKLNSNLYKGAIPDWIDEILIVTDWNYKDGWIYVVVNNQNDLNYKILTS
ncbi:hypothetical protein H8356DRAFT_1423051 [Neocallimastix lanati (nom. inval.)]|nr:hypothetical protein H8356DRAFT_1423051 [Neocallimastix sp. JGI-2020a]